MLSAADDYKVRIWELKTGRCVKTIEAHEQFVSCITWGRQQIGDANTENGPQTINVIATGSSDKVRPLCSTCSPRAGADPGERIDSQSMAPVRLESDVAATLVPCSHLLSFLLFSALCLDGDM
jgi:WD40 repeat protein